MALEKRIHAIPDDRHRRKRAREAPERTSRPVLVIRRAIGEMCGILECDIIQRSRCSETRDFGEGGV